MGHNGIDWPRNNGIGDDAFVNILSHTDSPIIFLGWYNPDHRFIEYISPNISQMGYSPDDFYSRRLTLDDLFYPPDIDNFKQALADLREEKEKLSFQGYIRGVSRDGSIGWLRFYTRAIADHENRITGFHCLLIDIDQFHHFEKTINLLNRFPAENPNPVIQAMPDGRIIYANQAGENILERWQRFTGLPSSKLIRSVITHCLKNPEEKNDTEITIGNQTFLFTLTSVSQDDVKFLFATDITRVKKSEEELKLASIVYEASIEGIIVTGPDGIIQSVNPAFTTITGYLPEEAIGQNPRILKSNRHDDSFYHNLWDCIQKTGKWRGEIWNRRKNNETYPQLLSISAIKDEDGNVKHYVGIFNDIIELKQKESEIQFRAYHDPLTALPNRDLFNDRLKVEISRAARNNQKIGVMFLDLDNFKYINDSLGHVMGDYLLQQVARRLLKCIRDIDTVARIGGDEFTILLPQVTGPKELVIVTQRILDIFKEPFWLQGHELFSATSIGISIYPSDGKDNIELLKNADLAMYHAKDQGKNNYAFFSSAMNTQVKKRLKMENQMRQALKKEQFLIHFQPLVDLNSGQMVGVESLVRWDHPTQGILSPHDFIPLAEENGIIIKLGQWVLEKSCLETLEWRRQGIKSIYTSINISTQQFFRRDFLDTVTHILEKTGLNTSYLSFQLSESGMTKNQDEIIRVMNALREFGIKLAIDDFGIGYSSLQFLKRFPVEILKIDRSFIQELSSDPDNRAIIRSIISLAKNLGFKVLGEGVETKEQLDFLIENGCDLMQGFYFSPPVPADTIGRMINDNKNLFTDCQPIDH